MKGLIYIMLGLVGIITVAMVFIFPKNIHEVSAKGEATMLARNINDAARSLLATPPNTVATTSFTLPSKIAGKNYEVMFLSGRIWVGLEDGRLFNFSTVISDSPKIFYGGSTVTLEKRNDKVIVK